MKLSIYYDNRTWIEPDFENNILYFWTGTKYHLSVKDGHFFVENCRYSIDQVWLDGDIWHELFTKAHKKWLISKIIKDKLKE